MVGSLSRPFGLCRLQAPEVRWWVSSVLWGRLPAMVEFRHPLPRRRRRCSRTVGMIGNADLD